MEPDAPRPTVAELEFELERLREECRRQEALQMEWTGNLGRWQWEVATNQVRFNPWKVRALGYGEHEVARPVGFELFTGLLHPDDHETVGEHAPAPVWPQRRPRGRVPHPRQGRHLEVVLRPWGHQQAGRPGRAASGERHCLRHQRTDAP